MLSPQWQTAVTEHETAIEACITAARRIADDEWTLSRAEGKWSPAQQLEHVGLSYQMVYDALNGKPPRARLGRVKQFLLRTFLLPKILRTDRFREGVPAPRELRPVSPTHDRVALEDLLRTRAATCLEMVLATNRPGAHVLHPYFGPLPLLSMLRLGTSHTRHHTGILTRM
jgi:DinB superfamily